MSICYFEGNFHPTAECALPVTDLAIQRGVGVFDSIRIYRHKPFALDAHLERLSKSADAAGILYGDIAEKIPGIIREGAARPDCPMNGECLAKPYITGGDVNQSGRFPHPRFFIIFEDGGSICPDEYKAGAALQPTPEGRPYPLIKTTNYLVGLMQCAGRSDVLECLYCPDGEITETLRSSFFLCKDGKIITAPTGRVLGGVTRNIILQLAGENGFSTEERCPLVSELDGADEAFLTSSWKEVMPVTRIGDKQIGSGKPGPVSAHLLKLFRSSLERWLD